MPRKSGITHEARVRLMVELKRYQQDHPGGCTATKLRGNLAWRKKETDAVIDDLVSSGMVFGDYLSSWVTSHHKGSSVAGLPYLLKVSPWGDEFLKHWEELNKLSTARDHYYSELEYDMEREEQSKTNQRNK